MLNEKLKQKTALIMAVLFLSGGVVFANDADDQITLPKNTLSLDVGHSLLFLSITGIMNLMDYSGTAFGIGAQYERQITDKVSAVLLFGYSTFDMSRDNFKWNMSSFSADVQGRFYPGQGGFFVSGILGYANIFADINEKKALTHYFKLGGKLGWRIDFGKPGGFVFEPAIGYYGTLGKNLDIDYGYDEELSFFNNMFHLLDNSMARILFTDGLRLSLCLGYRF